MPRTSKLRTLIVPRTSIGAGFKFEFSTRKQADFVLQPQEAWFVEEYLVDLNAVAAAERAGYEQPERAGPKLLASRKIQRSITLAKARRATRTQIESDYVVKRWTMVVAADPRELQELWMVACRYCWGVDHRFQMTDGEYREARAEHQEKMLDVARDKRIDFDEQGGPGYTINRFPCRGPDFVAFAKAQGQTMEATADHSCPECHGHGVATPIYHDTRTLSPAAALLYKGVRRTPNGGFEVIMRDQEHAEAMLAKHLGNFNPKTLPPKPVAEMQDDELAADLQANGVDIEGEFTRLDGGAEAPASGPGVPAPVAPAFRPRLDA